MIDKIIFKYEHHLPQIIYNNVNRIGESRLNDSKIYLIDRNYKNNNFFQFMTNKKIYERKLKLNQLLGINKNNKIENELINFFINNSIEIINEINF